MNTQKTLFKVESGNVTHLDFNNLNIENNVENSCIVLAENEEKALHVASLYDDNKIQYDNQVYCGVIIPVLCIN